MGNEAQDNHSGSQNLQMEVTFRVLRFDPLKDSNPYYQDYKVTIDKYTRVLEALLWVREEVDPTLNLRYSCRMAQCGSCGMLINYRQRLACKTLVKELETETVIIEPMPGYRVIKDLVVDMDNFFVKHLSVKPYLIREDVEEQVQPSTYYVQYPQELYRYLNYGYCILCGLCSSACPQFDSELDYLGPQALAQAYRYLADSRDQGSKARAPVINSNSGVWKCHFAGECSEACPKGVEPAKAIQMIRRGLILLRI